MWAYKFFVAPFLDAKGDGSMPAWMAFWIVAAMVVRLWSNAPIGWPDAFVVFFAFLGIPLYEAAMTVARLNPERLLELIASRLGIGEVGARTSGADVSIGPANDGAPGGDLDG